MSQAKMLRIGQNKISILPGFPGLKKYIFPGYY